MIWLSGVDAPVVRQLAPSGAVGLMLNPGNSLHLVTEHVPLYGVDSGVYGAWSRGVPHDWQGWWRWLLGTVPRGGGALFATAPDRVGDVHGTWSTSDRWLELVRLTGHRVALVAQDGAEDHAPMWDEDDRWDVLFIGGTDAWKLSHEALDCAREARARGKWVHVGRVNSTKRLARFAEHADSCDGTLLRFGARANTGVVRAMTAAARAPRLLPLRAEPSPALVTWALEQLDVIPRQPAYDLRCLAAVHVESADA